MQKIRIEPNLHKMTGLNQLFDHFNKIVHLVKYDLDDNCPVDTFVVMNQSMAQAGDHAPRNIGICFLEFGTEHIHLLADIVQRRSDRPLRKFFAEQKLTRNIVLLDLFLQGSPCVNDFLYPFLIGNLHAIFTPSFIRLS